MGTIKINTSALNNLLAKVQGSESFKFASFLSDRHLSDAYLLKEKVSKLLKLGCVGLVLGGVWQLVVGLLSHQKFLLQVLPKSIT